MNRHLSSESSRLTPFLLGGLIGTAFGLLIAPRAGRETRRQIRTVSARTRDRISTFITTGFHIYRSTLIAVESAIDAGRKSYLQKQSPAERRKQEGVREVEGPLDEQAPVPREEFVSP